ncbi:MAG: class I SAM-dependent methyltransferase [Candidatus Latescibacterota bacterium]
MSSREKDLARLVRDSYGTDQALRQFGDRVSQGLRTWEDSVIRDAFPEDGIVAVVGCGAGRELFSLQARGYSTFGLDISRPLLDRARQIATSMRVSARLAAMDGGQLPLGDRSVDVVTLWSQLLGNVSGAGMRRALLSEVFRVLRPGGTVSFSVHDRSRTLPMLDLDKTSCWDEPEVGDFLLREEGEQTTRYWHYFDEDEVVGLCQVAGFGSIEVSHTSDLGERWDNVFVAVATR